MVTRRLVLASASPARRRLLETAGFSPEVIVSGIDESSAPVTDTTHLVAILAEHKCVAVAGVPEAHDALVVACDSLLEIGGEAQGKPRDADQARARLLAQRGRMAILRTGHHLIDTRSGRASSAVGSTRVWFGDYGDDDVTAYLATGEPLAVAGSFTIDGRWGPFVERIDGDHGNVIGLSLPLFRRLLANVGVRVTDLWS